MSEKIKVPYAELKRLIVSEARLEDEIQKLKEKINTLEVLYKFEKGVNERLKKELNDCTLEDDEEEELLDD
ncbi:TPA: hypothetical protein ACUI23_000544 [Staphylococcus pseudintermedius]